MAGYIIDLQKSVVFPCTASNVLSERETEKTIPLTIASERIKYLGIQRRLKTYTLKITNH